MTNHLKKKLTRWESNNKINKSKATSSFQTSSNTMEVETKEISEDNDLVEVRLKIPKITKAKDKETEEKFNKLIEDKVLELKNQVADQAKSDYETYKKEGFEFHKYEVYSEFKVTYNKNNFLSIPLRTYYYTGGAHGLTIQYGYNFDFNKGTEVSLKNFFKEGFDYKGIINKEIRKQIQEKKDEYYPELKFDSIEDNQTYYIDGENLVVFYQQYEIAPYSSGIREFKIPLKDFKDNIKDEK